MSAMPKLTKYSQEKLKLQYVLPEKFTSDPIGGGFGWYCQANGENFFMSIKHYRFHFPVSQGDKYRDKIKKK